MTPKTKLDEVIETLKFYADPQTYLPEIDDYAPLKFDTDKDGNNGQLAREALETLTAYISQPCTECERLERQKKPRTRLKDTTGKEILTGHIVHWTDGGDDFDIETRIRTRWDRIAIVSMDGILPQFKVIDSPDEEVKQTAHVFCYGRFIYKDTKKYLTIVAENIDDYKSKFKNAGECMKWVLDQRGAG